mmetsp:Transcript_13559/g.45244  ORF Transcript_13559/g.45244 Transcript_13559/m.45244 type:complete len:200 (-) Transcript_13559:50-649(-)
MRALSKMRCMWSTRVIASGRPIGVTAIGLKEVLFIICKTRPPQCFQCCSTLRRKPMFQSKCTSFLAPTMHCAPQLAIKSGCGRTWRYGVMGSSQTLILVRPPPFGFRGSSNLARVRGARNSLVDTQSLLSCRAAARFDTRRLLALGMSSPRQSRRKLSLSWSASLPMTSLDTTNLYGQSRAHNRKVVRGGDWLQAPNDV